MSHMLTSMQTTTSRRKGNRKQATQKKWFVCISERLARITLLFLRIINFESSSIIIILSRNNPPYQEKEQTALCVCGSRVFTPCTSGGDLICRKNIQLSEGSLSSSFDNDRKESQEKKNFQLCLVRRNLEFVLPSNSSSEHESSVCLISFVSLCQESNM